MLESKWSAVLATSWVLVAAGCDRVVTLASSGDGGAESWATSGDGKMDASASTSVGGVGGGGPGLVEKVVGRRKGGGPVPVLVGDGMLGVTMVARASDDSSSVGFARLVSPSGALVVDGPLPGNHATWKRPGISSMAAPQIESPESFPLAKGVWTFDVEAALPIDLAVWERRTVDGAFHGGVIDLNVFASAGVTKKKHVLSVAADAFADFAGVELGDVRFFDLGEGYLEIDDDNVGAALEATRVAPTRPAINVIATRLIGGKYEGSAGYSTGIPGSPMSPGSRQAAIVWMVMNDADMDPMVLRHEAGHFAGLFHTSELIAGEVDSLDDTPSCPDVVATYAQCPDFPNTMFPTGGSGAGMFSPHQRAVVQASAVYRGVFAEGEAPMTPYGPPLEGGTPLSYEGHAFGEDAPSEAIEDTARAHSPRDLRSARWAREVGETAAAHLAGIGCPAARADYFDAFARLGLADVEKLSRLASSRDAPSLVRGRAVIALGRMGEELEANARSRAGDVVLAIAEEASAPTPLRVYALRAASRLSPTRAESAASTLRVDRDELVRAAATRLERAR